MLQSSVWKANAKLMNLSKGRQRQKRFLRGKDLALSGPLLKGMPTQKLLTLQCSALRKIVPYQLKLQRKRYKGLQMSSESMGEISAQ